ncbi:SRPBCC family protein [Variovorax sp. LjRoot84]|uniref:SRPBCC family protein n=1 Tax=Variovorax sp. LjRoot84 TaxID=3342340 RepID=UPI003ED0D569
MLKTIVIAIVVLLAALLGWAATKPDTFRVERSTTIKAPPGKILPLISDFRNWRAWSPYENLEPEMKRTLSGPPSGKGAVYAWEGEGKAGAGRMEITEVVAPASRVKIQLDFSKPFESHNTAEFTMQPEGDATKLTWAMYGPNPYMAKLMQVFFDMDTMVGKDFETGLGNLKTAAEKQG